MYCSKCGAELIEGKPFCANCGSAVEKDEATVEAVALAVPSEEKEPVIVEKPKKAGLDVGMLVWSIIGVVILSSPFSIPAIVMTVLAAVSSPEPAKKKLSIAKKLNVASVIYGAINAVIALITTICLMFFRVIVETVIDKIFEQIFPMI